MKRFRGTCAARPTRCQAHTGLPKRGWAPWAAALAGALLAFPSPTPAHGGAAAPSGAVVSTPIRTESPAGEYILGPEDQLTIAVLGAGNFPEYAQPVVMMVRPDGKISYGRLGEFTVAGKTAPQVQAEIEEGLKRYFKRPPTVSVVITGFRTPGLVYIWGDVAHPNAFPFRKGVGAVELLALAGGPTLTADLKQVTIMRAADRSLVKADLSRAGQEGEPDRNVALAPGDVVMVARLPRRTVTIVGGVTRGGQFDIVQDITLLEALKLVEGPREKADLKGATITRRDGSILPIDVERLLREGSDATDLKLSDGDTLVIPERLIRVYVSGEVNKPEALVLKDGATLLQAVAECGYFTKEADLKQVRIGRITPDGTMKAQPLDLSAIQNKTASVPSVMLQDGDFILVPTRGKKRKVEDYLPFIYPLDVFRRIFFP